MAIQIIARHARGDLYALLTAQGMENAGAQVISVTYDGEHHPHGAMIPSSKYIVFARFDDAATSFEAIDDAIEKEHIALD